MCVSGSFARGSRPSEAELRETLTGRSEALYSFPRGSQVHLENGDEMMLNLTELSRGLTDYVKGSEQWLAWP